MNAAYHPELLTTPEEKTNLLAGTGVDYCLMLDFTPDISRLTAKEFMTQILKERYQVKYLVIGYDHRFGHNRSEGFDDYVRYGQAIGIEVIRAQAYTDDIQIDTAVKEIVAVFSSIDIAIHNACLCTFANENDTELNMYERVFNVNYYGGLRLAKRVLPYMQEQKGAKLFLQAPE